jgi:hypothetical protein
MYVPVSGQVVITITLTEELEEEAVLEQIAALLDANHATYTWEGPE